MATEIIKPFKIENLRQLDELVCTQLGLVKVEWQETSYEDYSCKVHSWVTKEIYERTDEEWKETSYTDIYEYIDANYQYGTPEYSQEYILIEDLLDYFKERKLTLQITQVDDRRIELGLDRRDIPVALSYEVTIQDSNLNELLVTLCVMILLVNNVEFSLECVKGYFIYVQPINL